MAFIERIAAPLTDGELIAVRLLRHYCGMRDRDGDGAGLSRLVALGQSLRVPAAGSVALASVFQLVEALLGRRLEAECCCARRLSSDERAVVRLLGTRMPIVPGTTTPDIPHGLPGALAWAVLSVRRLCGEMVPVRHHPPSGGKEGCPFTHMVAA